MSMRESAMRAARREHEEATKVIESATVAVPSEAYLSLVLGAMATSLLLMRTGRRNVANFIGQWAPTILIMGLYKKAVEEHGRDYPEEGRGPESTGHGHAVAVACAACPSRSWAKSIVDPPAWDQPLQNRR